MLIATRKLIFQGVVYGRGDAVPAESSMNKTALLAAGLLRAATAQEQTAAADPKTLSRADLNAHAAAQGVADPESYPNKEALLAALDATKGDATPEPAATTKTAAEPADEAKPEPTEPEKEAE